VSVETPDVSEQALLEAARAGDRKAMDALLEKYQAPIYRFGMKMCGDPEDAKDILQETLLAVVRNVRDFRGGSAVSTWLYTIARSFCIKKRRRSKFAPDHEESLEAESDREARSIPDANRAPDEAMHAKQVKRVLEEAIGELDPIYREVLVLRDVEGLSAPEVAEVLGISVEAVKSRLHRARIAVRARVAPVLGIGAEEPGPSCPDAVSLLSRHMEGEISSEVCAQMERHLAECPRCRTACDSLRHTLTLCKATPTPKVPGAVQDSVRRAIQAFVAKTG
jgi:RNA polymerase sigma-70 factor (ECF subfamily)